MGKVKRLLPCHVGNLVNLISVIFPIHDFQNHITVLDRLIGFPVHLHRIFDICYRMGIGIIDVIYMKFLYFLRPVISQMCNPCAPAL